jgi:hypothetical protein
MVFDLDTLPGYLDLSEIKEIDKEIDLLNVYRRDENIKCKICLLNTDISKIKMQMKGFELWFPDTTLDFDFQASVYESLLKNFENHGFTDSYQELDKIYQDKKLTHEKRAFFNFLIKYWWDYGYKKGRIFMWMLLLLLFFTLITSFWLRHFTENIYPQDFIQKQIAVHKPFGIRSPIKRYLYKFYYSFIYCSVLFFGVKVDMDKAKKINLALIYLLFIYFAGMVCYGFLLNFIFGR